MIDTKTVDLSSTAFQWFDADYQNIDQLVFSSDENVCWFVLDDFIYEAGQPSVSGPAAVLPFAFSLLFVCLPSVPDTCCGGPQKT